MSVAAGHASDPETPGTLRDARRLESIAMMNLKPLLLGAALALGVTGALAQGATRIRGTVTAFNGTVLRVAPNGGGPEVSVTLTPNAVVAALVPARLSDIGPGRFIGTAATAQPDGTLVAREVHIFPEAMRGAGEGHRPFDLGPGSSMTNGTVGQEVRAAAGNRLTVTYKGGEKVVLVPPDVPVVTFAPGDRALLMPGAHVQLQARMEAAGAPAVADRVTVGKDGLVPPM